MPGGSESQKTYLPSVHFLYMHMPLAFKIIPFAFGNHVLELHVLVGIILSSYSLQVCFDLCSWGVVATPFWISLKCERIGVCRNIASYARVASTNRLGQLLSLYNEMQNGGRERYERAKVPKRLLILKPGTTNIRILLINRQLEVLDRSREEDAGDNARHACSENDNLHGTVLVHGSGGKVILADVVEEPGTSHLFLESVHIEDGVATTQIFEDRVQEG